MDIDPVMERPEQRRWWLLAKALECAPLDRALELARAAEEFITTEVLGEGARPLPVVAALAATRPASAEEPSAGSDDQTTDLAEGSRILLTPERRRALLDRLAGGARNDELAAEFGLTARQVQGLRIGTARATKAGQGNGEAATPQGQPQAIASTVEDVVRYLRQQDDVVVPQGEGSFLVNGRFHLGLTELVEKANRIRGRQRKPFFQLDSGSAAGTVAAPPYEAPRNGHRFA